MRLKAVLMAGGEGTRLRPLTSNQPKPMVNIFNQPVMSYIIELLKKYEIKDIVTTLQFLPQLIKNYYGDGSDLGINLNYAVEEEPLGTAGSVKNTEQFIDGTFLVISGDAITDFNLKKAIDFHKKKKSLATLVLARVESPLEFGVVITEKDGKITRFLEKPSWAQVFSDTVNTGLYILEPEVLDHIPSGKNVDFSKDLFPKLLKEKKPLYGYVADGYWCDIGNLEQYRQVHEDILNNKTKIKVPGIKMGSKVWVGNDASVHPSVKFKGSAFIGNHCKVEEGAVIGDGTIIGNNVVVKNNAKTAHSIIQENAYIGPSVSLDGCIVGKNCDVKNGVNVRHGAVVGDDCLIGANAIIKPNVKIYPFKSVDAGATISRSIIWETRGMRSLFGTDGISGIANVDITPELATRVAMAYGTSLAKESLVVTSRDTSRVSRFVKRAIIAGLTATGIHVRDLRVAPTPVNRFNVATTAAEGGIHVQISPFDPQTIQINFFNSNGINMDAGGQRNIEKYYSREDYRRAFHNEVGEILFPPRTLETYSAGLLRTVDTKRIKDAKFKVIIDHAHGL
ncbi:MAG TPA: mannose-1-phosphate guanyltransferase, partial [Actinobacteria bacterium]|nr:mannose-1-phosphate guanyltransferase [Actinomycetota bacterium]